MILHFSQPIILILLFCFIVCYKYLFRKNVLINVILDFLTGTILLHLSTDYFENQIFHLNEHGRGHGGIMYYLTNFVLFAILYTISTIIFYSKRNKSVSILVPIMIYVFYIIDICLFEDYSKLDKKTTLFSIFIAFFPIYIYNYFKIFNKYNYLSREEE